MRVISTLYSRLKRKYRYDPVFGSMLYMGDRLKYWEGKAFFEPTNSNIEAFVDGKFQDSMEQQHIFFQKVVHEWSTLRKNIGEMILERWHEPTPKPSDNSFWDLYTVSSISIPKASFADGQWEISVMRLSDPDHLWTVHMNGYHPQQTTLDG